MTTSQSTATATSGDQRRLSALAALDLPRYVLLPGDPDRIKVMAEQWNDAKIIDLPRGYCAAVGTYEGVRIGAVSTSIGAPSLELVFTDLARLNVDTFIRVGTTGTLHADIATGSLIINDAAVRLDGTTHLYVRPEFPAAASHEVTFALVDAAAAQGLTFRVGTGATAGSFLAGQGRPAFKDYRSPEGDRIFEEMKRAGVLNFEMETAALLTLARLYHLRAGAVCSVIANRISGDWGDNGGIERACRVGAEAVRRLAAWDAAGVRSGRATLTLEVMKPV
ncbi:nucleoside phosphorylase [Reyranella sp. CPCC 100927]|uniref:nucleoside phosphorylase n=1 Tax=Reyranella sp. CPCC 100927 TaxID=2599616 RepID=UPI0011B3AC0F|nr:nucleoside phosphorylase [Reyranella sp. CPCC 100927]TWT05772.1 nucleoside phosphorylase [Reyranella sp. CPCC 100927]